MKLMPLVFANDLDRTNKSALQLLLLHDVSNWEKFVEEEKQSVKYSNIPLVGCPVSRRKELAVPNAPESFSLIEVCNHQCQMIKILTHNPPLNYVS